jgi:hypothetical protein
MPPHRLDDLNTAEDRSYKGPLYYDADAPCKSVNAVQQGSSGRNLDVCI